MEPSLLPDPRQGVFETMLVVAGVPLELAAHLDRLAASVATLYGAELPGDSGDRAREAAATEPLGRLRLTVVPGRTEMDRPLELSVYAGPVEPEIVFPTRGADLRVVSRPGGLGPHKWVERPGLDHPIDGPGALIGDGGELLEAGWANLFAVSGGVLRTPPSDGRILPGLARAAVLELADDLDVEACEEPLHAADMHAADETFLTNSIRGIEAGLTLDGVTVAGTGPLSRRLAAALRQRWGLRFDPDALAAPAAVPTPDPPAR